MRRVKRYGFRGITELGPQQPDGEQYGYWLRQRHREFFQRPCKLISIATTAPRARRSLLFAGRSVLSVRHPAGRKTGGNERSRMGAQIRHSDRDR